MAQAQPDTGKPVLALAIGDPAGVGPELAAKVIADADIRAAADLIVVGDRRVLWRGADVAGVKLDLAVCRSTDELRPGHGTVLVDLAHLDPDTIEVGTASKAGGAFALKNFRTAIELAAAGRAGAVCFTPFNKAAMRMAHPAYDDEIGYGAEVLGTTGPASEFNILDNLWNARVTSHVPLSAVASLITRESVLKGIRLTDASLRDAGFATPRIAVAGLNPHAGDGGNFGREEIDTIEPAVQQARPEGINARRSVPARHGIRPRHQGSVRRRRDHVPRPGPDRDEADRLRSRRHASRRVRFPAVHAGAWLGLRHRRQGRRPCRGEQGGRAARRRDGCQERCR